MDRLTKDERAKVYEIIAAETPLLGHPGSHAMQNWLSNVEGMALRLASLYEGACSKDLGTKGNELRARLTEQLEREVKDSFARVGLGLYLNGDPRGNPVGIHTPKTGKYNTMGGAEAGWRL